MPFCKACQTYEVVLAKCGMVRRYACRQFPAAAAQLVNLPKNTDRISALVNGNVDISIGGKKTAGSLRGMQGAWRRRWRVC